MYNLVPLNCLHIWDVFLMGLPKLLISQLGISDGKQDFRFPSWCGRTIFTALVWILGGFTHIERERPPPNHGLFILLPFEVVPHPGDVRLGLCPRLDPHHRQTTRSSWGHTAPPSPPYRRLLWLWISNNMTEIMSSCLRGSIFLFSMHPIRLCMNDAKVEINAQNKNKIKIV